MLLSPVDMSSASALNLDTCRLLVVWCTKGSSLMNECEYIHRYLNTGVINFTLMVFETDQIVRSIESHLRT